MDLSAIATALGNAILLAEEHALALIVVMFLLREFWTQRRAAERGPEEHETMRKRIEADVQIATALGQVTQAIDENTEVLRAQATRLAVLEGIADRKR